MAIIYGDESGFSGDNLLDEASDFFVYATVAMEPDKAQSIVERAMKEFRIQGGELKGANIVNNIIKRNKGTEIISCLISECLADSHLIYFNKKYALACKFYQYIFDDVLADESWLLYEIEFPLFVSNALHMDFVTKDALAIELFQDFQDFMRAKDEKNLRRLFSLNMDATRLSPVLEAIFRFTLLHKDQIRDELEPILGGDNGGKWILDLTVSALHPLLTYWGQKFDSLEVYCDASKPLLARKGQLDLMVGRSNRASFRLRGENIPLTFSLSKPIELVRSKDYPGVQIADVFAATLCYALNKGEGNYWESLFETYKPYTSQFSMFPHSDFVDLLQRKPFVSAMLLTEFVERSVSGRDLLANIRPFINGAFAVYPDYIEGLYNEACGRV